MSRSKQPKEEQDGTSFPEQWQELLEAGKAPEATGRTAEEARRSQERVARGGRHITPAETRRRTRRLSLTVSEELIEELRAICAKHGRMSQKFKGQGTLSSDVLEPLLWFLVDAYKRGDLLITEKNVTTTQFTLHWKDEE